MKCLASYFNNDKEYKEYVTKILFLFEGELTVKDILSKDKEVLDELIKFKVKHINEVIKYKEEITELEKENKELTEYFNSNELLLKMRKADKKLDSVVDIIKDSVDEDGIKRIKYSLYKELLPEIDWNKIKDIIKEVEEELTNKDKIKVYIKEQGISEYVVLWDKFDKMECQKWLKSKNIYTRVRYKEDIDNSNKIVAYSITGYRFGLYPLHQLLN